MTTTLLITLLLIGFSAGLLSGLIGVGGGIILVPAMVFFLGYTQYQAQGTSLGVLSFPVVILAFLNYYAAGKANGQPVDLKVIGLLAIAFFAGGYFGSAWALRINQEMLKKLFAFILLFSAIKLLEWDKWLVRWIKSFN
ncbi:MAG: sulfite exporter TauE/SafE family protein [Chitinophagaceae bacterium]